MTEETEQFQQIAPAVNVGAVTIESERAIAEAQGKIVLARRFPRSMAAAHSEFLDACKSKDFAATAFYAVPNRGNGPSIRFAEEVARCYGNFEYGHRELSRSDGKSEIEVYAIDWEKNNHSKRQITVMHVVDRKDAPPKVLRDQADIDNRIANIASKQIRGRILALVPKHFVAAGIAECKKTLAGNNEKPVSQRIADMASAFGRLGVTIDMLQLKLGHKIDDTNIDELADLIGIFNSLRDGQSKVGDWFGTADAEAPPKTLREAILPKKEEAPKAETPRAESTKVEEPPPRKPKSAPKPPADPEPPVATRPASAPAPIEPPPAKRQAPPPIEMD